MMIKCNKDLHYFPEAIFIHCIHVEYYTGATTHANGNLCAHEKTKRGTKEPSHIAQKNCAEISISAQPLSLFPTQLLTLSQNNYQFFR